MDVLLVVGIIIVTVVIVELCGNRAPTVAHTDSWRQAVTGMIQEPAAATFVQPALEPTVEVTLQSVPITDGAGTAGPIVAQPGVAPTR